MIGWLAGFRAQNGSVAYWSYATFVGRLGECTAPGGGECGPCRNFASNTLALALQLRKITPVPVLICRYFGMWRPWVIHPCISFPFRPTGRMFSLLLADWCAHISGQLDFSHASTYIFTQTICLSHFTEIQVLESTRRPHRR